VPLFAKREEGLGFLAAAIMRGPFDRVKAFGIEVGDLDLMAVLPERARRDGGERGIEGSRLGVAMNDQGLHDRLRHSIGWKSVARYPVRGTGSRRGRPRHVGGTADPGPAAACGAGARPRRLDVRLPPPGFIAKAEVGTWPGIGLIARLGRTVFVDRRPRSSRTQRDAVTARLATGESLVLFAGGTSSDGRRVLPFKSTLFGALEPAAATVAVVPVTIAYERFRGGLGIGHHQRPFYGWYGAMTLAPHLWQVLASPGAEVQARLHAPLPASARPSRKAAARAAEDAVAAGLAALRAA
jgi:hypothetical protein